MKVVIIDGRPGVVGLAAQAANGHRQQRVNGTRQSPRVQEQHFILRTIRGEQRDIARRRTNELLASVKYRSRRVAEPAVLQDGARAFQQGGDLGLTPLRVHDSLAPMHLGLLLRGDVLHDADDA